MWVMRLGGCAVKWVREEDRRGERSRVRRLVGVAVEVDEEELFETRIWRIREEASLREISRVHDYFFLSA